MSFKSFMKDNKKTKDNVSYKATKSLLDEKGNPLEWEIRALSTSENDLLRDECTIEVPVKGRKGMYRPKVDTSKYTAKLLTKAIVNPDLYNKDLQDSYGVMTPEELLKEMIDNPGEYSNLTEFVMTHCGFTTLDDLVDNAKN